MAERLPTLGETPWKTILDGYLGVAHNTDGTLKTGIYFQDSDPGAVGAGSIWITSSTRITRVRNGDNDEWLTPTFAEVIAIDPTHGGKVHMSPWITNPVLQVKPADENGDDLVYIIISQSHATVTDGEFLRFTAVADGTAGNGVTVELVDPLAIDQSISVGVAGDAITVNLATDGGGAPISTAAEVVAAIAGDVDAAALITAVAIGDPDAVVLAGGPYTLADGRDEAKTLGMDAVGGFGIFDKADTPAPQPVVPLTSPTVQDVIDALVTLGWVTQSD